MCTRSARKDQLLSERAGTHIIFARLTRDQVAMFEEVGIRVMVEPSLVSDIDWYCALCTGTSTLLVCEFRGDCLDHNRYVTLG